MYVCIITMTLTGGPGFPLSPFGPLVPRTPLIPLKYHTVKNLMARILVTYANGNL